MGLAVLINTKLWKGFLFELCFKNLYTTDNRKWTLLAYNIFLMWPHLSCSHGTSLKVSPTSFLQIHYIFSQMNIKSPSSTPEAPYNTTHLFIFHSVLNAFKCVLIQGPNSSVCYFRITFMVNIDCVLWSLKPSVRNLLPLPIPDMLLSPYLITFTSKYQSACHNCTLHGSIGHFLCTTVINVSKYGGWVLLCPTSMSL